MGRIVFDSSHRGLVCSEIKITLAPLSAYETWSKEYEANLPIASRGAFRTGLASQPKKLRDIVHAIKRGATYADLKPRFGSVENVMQKLPKELK